MTITENTIKAAQDTGGNVVWVVVTPGDPTHYAAFSTQAAADQYAVGKGAVESVILMLTVDREQV